MDGYSAHEQFGVEESFADEISTITEDFMKNGDGDSLELLHRFQAVAKTPQEREFAAYAFGKISGFDVAMGKAMQKLEELEARMMST